ncbi:uncharacterized protein LOC110651319 isoform X2 [Hevea brasiliensis]|uniref:uncharacterized protein LOC110651319 isoform X2 n=1 Tax=Hevea brasiliensis TaxID=3981 RepID=UPI0025F2004F|nr:uncharacterized protein LOC110651319 isoform X2 [Hevea brasiliensis]
MDDSWRMRMGMPSLPRRRSIEDTLAGSTRLSMEAMDPDDFADVFGGPPRSVLSRKFSGDFTSSSTSFYEEIFRPQEFVASVEKKSGGGRSLPAFRIPAKGEGFYSDVFGWEEGRRSRDRSKPNSKAKSKSNSSSVLSSEELSPHRRTVTGDDVALSSFASKLRWNSTAMRPEEQARKEEMPSFPRNFPSHADNYYMENEYNDSFRSSYIKVSRQVSSPETISLEPNSYQSIKVSVDDLEVNSPSSLVSSLCQEQEASAGKQAEDEEMEQAADEVMSSYVIEINSDHREAASEAISIDEAIAWAKEKFQAQSLDRQQKKDLSPEVEESPNTREFTSPQIDGHGRTQSPSEEELKKWRSEEEKDQSEKDQLQIELKLLDEDVRLWSEGKETNIRLLLSTLHHILWSNSGWCATSLTSLIESSHVKKAYQKARLCLHPDKLQQRGATLQQKYVAEKAFSIVQDAWAAFISQDVLFN